MNQSFSAETKILIGISSLAEVIQGKQFAFILADEFLIKSSQIDDVLNILDRQSVAYSLYTDITPDPNIEAILDGIEAIQEFNPDVLIAIGGGSVIDTSKAVYYFSLRQGFVKKMPLIAIPTTSGTGSEVTSFTVVKDEALGVKYPLVDDLMLPNYALLDARFTKTVPSNIVAYVGMDAFTHALEALVSKNATDFSDALAEKAIKLLHGNLLKSYRSSDDFPAKQAMHHASCLAGMAFNNAGLGLNHAMAHALGGHFHVAHGLINAILLPYVMQYNAGCYEKLTKTAQDYARVAKMIGVNGSSVRMGAFNLIRAVKKINAALAIPASFKNLGIAEKDFLKCLDIMAMLALDDQCIRTNPRTPTLAAVKAIYLQAYSGSGRIGIRFDHRRFA